MKVRTHRTEAYSGSCQLFKMEVFVKMVNASKLLTVVAKNSILDVGSVLNKYLQKSHRGFTVGSNHHYLQAFAVKTQG